MTTGGKVGVDQGRVLGSVEVSRTGENAALGLHKRRRRF